MIKAKWPRFSFTGLLLVLIAFFLIQPIFSLTYYGSIIFEMLITTILLSTVYILSDKKLFFSIALILVVPALIFNWSNFYSFSHIKQTTSFILESIFLVFSIIVIGRQVFQSKEIDADVIMGAICIYTLSGLTWGLFYSLIEFNFPGSFAGEIVSSENLNLLEVKTNTTISMTYYSFVTLTTLGFGDIIPITPIARSLAIIETLFGQFYIAITISTLVGLRNRSRME